MKTLSAVVGIVPVVVFATQPFDGTWRINVHNAQFPKKPKKFKIANGVYKCLTCDPPFSVKADGKDHKRIGSPYSDIINVRIVDPNSIEVVSKKRGKTVLSERDTVSADGNTATVEFTDQPEGSDQPVTGTLKLVRVAKGPLGSHAFSRFWRTEKADNISDNGLTFTYNTTADRLTMTTQTGESFTAKFNGKDYPYKGNPGISSVSCKRINANIIEETDKRDGNAISTARITVSPDGRTMTRVSHGFCRNDTATITAEKQ